MVGEEGFEPTKDLVFYQQIYSLLHLAALVLSHV